MAITRKHHTRCLKFCGALRTQGATARGARRPLPAGGRTPARGPVARALARALLAAALQPWALQPARDVRLARPLGVARAQAPPLTVPYPCASMEHCALAMSVLEGCFEVYVPMNNRVNDAVADPVESLVILIASLLPEWQVALG